MAGVPGENYSPGWHAVAGRVHGQEFFENESAFFFEKKQQKTFIRYDVAHACASRRTAASHAGVGAAAAVKAARPPVSR
jgi:hypothetical protein